MNTDQHRWPTKPFQVALVEPEIPPNTGNIARLCAATGSPLHLVGQLGFRLSDKELKRAGLDYWDSVKMTKHESFELFMKAVVPERCFFFSARGERSYFDIKYNPGDILVFGGESKGLPGEILKAYSDSVVKIPILNEAVRSLNLATAVGIVLYEALRQTADVKKEM